MIGDQEKNKEKDGKGWCEVDGGERKTKKKKKYKDK